VCFKAMLEAPMLESKTKRIKIVDMDAWLLECFLRFLYSGSLKVACSSYSDDNFDPDEDGETQFQFLKLMIIVGDKYGVSNLVDQCAVLLRHCLNTQTFCRIFALAHQLNHQTLKHACLHFVGRDKNAVVALHDSVDFDTMDAQLVRELSVFIHQVGKPKQSDAHEFADSSTWGLLSYAQLQRACDERGLTNQGDRAILIARLCDQSGHGKKRVSSDGRALALTFV